jgi:tetratricopeptide (TPR) repeat protein
VPIVTEATTNDIAKSNPRATHEELVNFILADLDKAEIGLESYTPVSKNFPDLAVVYGLKAKVYMWDGQFAKAAEYARKAIDKSGATPMSESQWHNPTTGFNTATSAWMWYLHPTASNMGNLANFIGHISNEADWGYASLSKLQMARSLYDAIPATDFRKYSYLDPDRSTYAYQSVRGNAWLDEQPDYMSLKFRPVGGDYNTYSVGAAADIPVMRVEEMYLIEAEAVGASQNVAAGVQLLNNFMKQYRQSNYNFSTGDLRNFQLEVLKQMRIEFWGEGIAFPTAKRLKPDVIQNYEGTNFIEDIFKINCKGVKPNWTLMIPKTEVDSNTALQGMNNPDPTGAIPKRPTPIGEFAPGNN